jgi:hypothetical protein
MLKMGMVEVDKNAKRRRPTPLKIIDFLRGSTSYKKGDHAQLKVH